MIGWCFHVARPNTSKIRRLPKGEKKGPKSVRNPENGRSRPSQPSGLVFLPGRRQIHENSGHCATRPNQNHTASRFCHANPIRELTGACFCHFDSSSAFCLRQALNCIRSQPPAQDNSVQLRDLALGVFRVTDRMDQARPPDSARVARTYHLAHSTS